MGINQQSLLRNVEIRAAAILTTSYVASSSVQTFDCTQGMLLYDFTIGSLTSCEIKIQVSNDNTNWYDMPFDNTSGVTPSGGEYVAQETSYVRQLKETASRYIPFGIKAHYVRAMAKGTGTVTSSSLRLQFVAGAI